MNNPVARAPLALVEAVFVVKQLLSAIAYLHAANIVHRDIKPENTLIWGAARGAGGERLLHVKITDYGTMRTAVEGEGLTVGSGTRNFMAPEVDAATGLAAGRERKEVASYDGGADVFSVGATFFFLVRAGRPRLCSEALAARLHPQFARAPPAYAYAQYHPPLPPPPPLSFFPAGVGRVALGEHEKDVGGALGRGNQRDPRKEQGVVQSARARGVGGCKGCCCCCCCGGGGGGFGGRQGRASGGGGGGGGGRGHWPAVQGGRGRGRRGSRGDGSGDAAPKGGAQAAQREHAELLFPARHAPAGAAGGARGPARAVGRRRRRRRRRQAAVPLLRGAGACVVRRKPLAGLEDAGGCVRRRRPAAGKQELANTAKAIAETR